MTRTSPRSPLPRALLILAGAAALALLPACRRDSRDEGPRGPGAGPPRPPALLYEDRTAAAGVTFVSLPRGDAAGYGQGVAVADVDGDGDLDLFFPQDDGPCALYRNDGGFRFTEVAAAAGVLVDPVAAHAKCAAFLDFDRDGRPDLFVGTAGGGNRLFRNRGDGTFEDVTVAAGLGGGTLFTVMAAVGDFDGDGFPDLYECNFAPTDYADPLALQGVPAPNRLWRNGGDGTFTDVAPLLGVDDDRATWAAQWWDIDGDGDLDLLVANDRFFYPGRETRDRVFLNGGAGAGFAFTERGADFGLAEAHFGMGFALGDLDGDGLPDVYVSDLGPNELRLGGDPLPWPDRAPERGVAVGLDPHGFQLISWGAAIEDLDADGLADLVVLNGHLSATDPGPLATNRQPPSLFLAERDPAAPGGRRLRESAGPTGLAALDPLGGRAVVPCDLDGDGDLDLVISTRFGRALLLRAAHPNAGPWYGVRLRGTRSTTEGLGALLELEQGGRRLVRPVTTGGQPGSCLPPEAILAPGPGTRGRATLTVRWPSGAVQVVEPERNGWITVVE